MRLFGAPDWPRERLWAWRLLYPLVRAVATTFVPLRAEGLEHLPPKGAYLLVSNHISWWDPPMIEFALRLPVRFMAKQELFRIPIVGWALRAGGKFPVRRGESDRRALETALRVLAAGQPVGYFPEGTRSKDGRLRRAKPGVAFLARRSGMPLVPVAVTGTREAAPRIPARSKVLVRIGPAFTLAGLDRGAPMDEQALADAIMRRVAELLPNEMRGEYATLH